MGETRAWARVHGREYDSRGGAESTDNARVVEHKLPPRDSLSRSFTPDFDDQFYFDEAKYSSSKEINVSEHPCTVGSSTNAL